MKIKLRRRPRRRSPWLSVSALWMGLALGLALSLPSQANSQSELFGEPDADTILTLRLNLELGLRPNRLGEDFDETLEGDSSAPETPLQGTMRQAGELFRTLSNALKDTATDGPDRNQTLLPLLDQLASLLTVALTQPPATAATEPALADFKSRINGEIEWCRRLKLALSENRNGDARAIALTMGQAASAGHRLYRPR